MEISQKIEESPMNLQKLQDLISHTKNQIFDKDIAPWLVKSDRMDHAVTRNNQIIQELPKPDIRYLKLFHI